MVIYGLTMQDKPHLVPKEVAEWLFDRVARYPNIEFKIDMWEPHIQSEAERAEYEHQVRSYVRYCVLDNKNRGVSSVLFPYLSQGWQVRIIGGTDKDGNIIDHRAGLDTLPLRPKLRAEIAGVDDATNLVESDGFIGVPRRGEDMPDSPEFVAFEADGSMTSELSMTGKEFADLLSDPKTKDEASQAIWAKDWATLKRLKEQK